MSTKVIIINADEVVEETKRIQDIPDYSWFLGSTQGYTGLFTKGVYNLRCVDADVSWSWGDSNALERSTLIVTNYIPVK